jgi:hypothetical protein
MTTENEERQNCLGVSDAIDRVIKSDAQVHLGRALREILLAMRAVTDAVIVEQSDKTRGYTKVNVTESGE